MPFGFRPGLGFARLMMVIGSFWPLFLLWAIKGNPVLDYWLWITVCCVFICIPNLFLSYRIWRAEKQDDRTTILVENPEDHRDHILVYLFAILLPIYSLNIETYRDFLVVVVALFLVLFIFWRMDLHYMNLYFSILGYSLFTINPNQQDGQLRRSSVLITRRSILNIGRKITAHRISDTVFIELENG